MAPLQVPGIVVAAVLYEAGFPRSEILTRLQDPEIMKAMFEPRAYTEAEALAAYNAVALDAPMSARCDGRLSAAQRAQPGARGADSSGDSAPAVKEA
jgi:hypothetical protein